jgi:oligoendopeptidase F
MMVRFERACYTLRAGGTTLTAERLDERWLEATHEYYGDSVKVGAVYRTGWSYIPHFIGTRFYTYAYSFAHLVSLLLVARFRASPKRFASVYREFLSAGSSASPAMLLAGLGVDIEKPMVWHEAFAELERIIERGEHAFRNVR